MSETSLNMLSHSQLFSGVGLEALTLLEESSSVINVDENEVLFYQGDPSDSFYLLLEGKLLVELTTYSGQSKIIGHIDPGQSVGEFGALTNQVRSLTVTALRRSRLLKIPAKQLIDICHRYPAVMFSILHPMVVRSRQLLHLMSSEKSGKHIVVVPANGDVSLDQFQLDLMSIVRKINGMIILSDYQPEFAEYHSDPERVKENIREIKQRYGSVRRCVYILKSHHTPLARYAFKKASKIYVIGAANGSILLDKHVEDKLKSRQLRLSESPHLVILHAPNTIQPIDTDKWLNLYPFGIHHHVRLTNKEDYSRLVRFMRDRAVGLVLSGGGTRGWAHLGVIKALQEANIPIDIIGGTSVGAVIAASYALHQDYEDAYRRFYKIITASEGTVSWRSLTWPIVSLFNARKYTQAHQDVFGEARMEDLWIPCFGVSCNLATNREHVHRSGMIWEIIRASTSIPGLIPPMLFNGELHLDGGLMNNLPVDVMRQLLGKKAKIIAVELNSFMMHPQPYCFPPVLSLWQTLLAKLGLGDKHYVFPRFIDMFMQSLFIGSFAKAEQNSLQANQFISLELGRYSLLKSNPDQARQLIEIGYQEAVKKIKQSTRQLKG